eukprot:10899657-Alexandrium_andersonii.AAC.1
MVFREVGVVLVPEKEISRAQVPARRLAATSGTISLSTWCQPETWQKEFSCRAACAHLHADDCLPLTLVMAA